ncbi:MAG TPA: hypothetical protein DCS93_37585 [Microscillaceae bacterium]|nr:hypothetical protein [Microscillaceae bacterium]
MESTGIITKTSQQNFEATYQKLKNIIDNNPNLNIMLELDHQANAAKNGLDLRPTRIIVFGNPKLGTPLMQNAQTIGLDLPQKVLVYEEADGTVKVSYNDPLYLKGRHGLSETDEILSKVVGALDKITSAAIEA